ncbi:MAG TPA: archaellin/type IV pilin N-terminal domain-containing protein [Thermoplasmata archaeon]|nr:archaellin/type IV pilin N-terminal domain-containing protein [Thermoplasmata archaeon]
MNVFGKNERTWRKARKRGVSPIIATILLVAITVVLAAVLYVLISGLTHGTGSAPLGTNFAWGTPVNATGTQPTGCTYTTGTHYCYTIEVLPNGGLTTSNIQFSLRNSLGSTTSWPTGVTISLTSPSTAGVLATYSTTSSGWTPAAGFNGVIPNGGGISILTAAQGATNGLLGDEIVAIGVSGYSGTVPSASFS